MALSQTPEGRKKRNIPIPGQRIGRTVMAVWLCLGIYVLRGRHGAPFYSILAAMQCMQPYASGMWKMAKKRLIGTLIGAFFGSIVVYSSRIAFGDAFESSAFHYLLLGLGVGFVIYFTVLLKITDASYFSAVVFLSVSMNHIGDEQPHIYILNRVLDTLFGIGVGAVVNSLHLPRTRDRETLFVSGIDHVLLREDRELTPFTKVELNRFIQDGMHLTVMTKQTPATVRDLLKGVNLKMPIIAMSGAVLYDLKTMEYLHVEYMRQESAQRLAAFLHEKGRPFFVSTIEDNLLGIYYRQYPERDILDEGQMRADAWIGEDGTQRVSRYSWEALGRLYERKKNSPYRNYVHVDHDVLEHAVYFTVVDREERIDELCETLFEYDWGNAFHPVKDTFDCIPGDCILRIYSAGATNLARLRELKKLVNAPKSLIFGGNPASCDVVVPENGSDRTVLMMKKHFEPMDIRGWKNIIRL